MGKKCVISQHRVIKEMEIILLLNRNYSSLEINNWKLIDKVRSLLSF